MDAREERKWTENFVDGKRGIPIHKSVSSKVIECVMLFSLGFFWNSVEFRFHKKKPWKGLDKLLPYPGGYFHFGCCVIMF